VLFMFVFFREYVGWIEFAADMVDGGKTSLDTFSDGIFSHLNVSESLASHIFQSNVGLVVPWALALPWVVHTLPILLVVALRMWCCMILHLGLCVHVEVAALVELVGGGAKWISWCRIRRWCRCDV